MTADPKFKYEGAARAAMLDLDWRVRETGDVALVAVVVESEAPTPRRVRVESRLDGPVRPPRRGGVPERGFDETGYEGVVPAGGRLAVGFASPADPVDPPVALVADERADARPDQEGAGTLVGTGPSETSPSAADVLRELGSPAPPRDAVPRPGASGAVAAGRPGGVDAPAAGGDAIAPGADSPAARGGATDDSTAAPADTSQAPGDVVAGSRRDDHAAGGGSEAVPAPVASWLADVAARVERAERLADARTLPAAADAVAATGGLAGVEDLVAALSADRAALLAVADRAETLAGRCDAAEVPLAAYRELA